MKWGKIQTIIAIVVGLITITAGGIGAYNHFAKQSDHEALVTEVHEKYVEKEDFTEQIVAMNKVVQQSNLDFWIWRTKQDMTQLYAELRESQDSIEQEQIRDQLEQLKEDLKNYRKQLDQLKVQP